MLVMSVKSSGYKVKLNQLFLCPAQFVTKSLCLLAAAFVKGTPNITSQ